MIVKTNCGTDGALHSTSHNGSQAGAGAHGTWSELNQVNLCCEGLAAGS